MTQIQRLLIFALFLGCFIDAEAAERSLDIETIQIPKVSKEGQRLGSRKQSFPPSLFRLPRPYSDLKEQNERVRTTFNAEADRLRESIKTEPGKHVVVFDCHGTLTNRNRPECDEGPYRQIIDLYCEFSALGVTVLISSAWHDMLQVLQSLRAAGIAHTAEMLTETVLEERTKAAYTIVHVGNIVSARQEPHFEGIFANKLEAAIWCARRQGILDISSITLFDDQDVNIDTFVGRHGEVFGVRYPAPHGILVPPYAVFNPE